MEETSFVLSLVTLVIILLLRKRLTAFLNESLTLSYKIQSEWIVYILTILFMIVIGVGMLMDDTKKKYANISESFEKVRTMPDDKPHPWFDINFDIFK